MIYLRIDVFIYVTYEEKNNSQTCIDEGRISFSTTTLLEFVCARKRDEM